MVRYQVFLSFRGPETRENLAQYLYDQLRRFGVEAFLDREEIRDGDCISRKIEEAIERSDVCVPIFSQDFASSAACLMEVAHMVKSGKKILPIFFFVKPCDVRYRRGTYRESFKIHRAKKYHSELIIREWEYALEKIAGFKGPEFKQADLKAALRAALEAALGEIGHGLEFKKAALGAALESALEAALQAALQTALDGQTDVIRGLESKKAALEAALKAALGEIGVIKRPEFKEAALEEMGGTKGRFYNDLFSGFRGLEDFISRLGNFLMDKKEKTNNLVGVDRHVPKLVRTLGFDYQDGRVVQKQEMNGRMVFVVWGMPGVGKTTLAKEVYYNIRHLFGCSSFLENVHYKTIHEGVVSLQNKLIHDLRGGGCQEVKYPENGTTKIKHLFQRERVLIVLDNVEKQEEIKPLAEEVTWFGPGSIIILTSRRRDIITHYKVPEDSKGEHQVSSMDEDDALELFYKHAIIKPDDLPQNYNDLSRKITSAVGRLPFAIVIVGDYLRGKDKKIWEEAPGRLKGELEEQVVPLFKESYDHLRKNTREIFLDVACFFIGVKQRNPHYMWNAQGRQPYTSVDELQNISFLKIGEENEFWMHNQLQIFGRETVNKNCEDPREPSRLWDFKDVQTTLRKKQVKEKVKALRVTPDRNRDSQVNSRLHWKSFLNLEQLTFLHLDGVEIEGNCEDDIVDIRGNTEDVLLDLVWLDWHGCREKSQLFALSMENLKAKVLKVLNAKDCPSIFASLKFPDPVPLERLILEGCLLEIPTDPRLTSGLVNLVTLNMKGCTYFKYLTQALCSLKALKELFIDGTKIKKLEFNERSLPSLEILSACECEDLVDVNSITFLKTLQKLSLRSCKNLKQLPAFLGLLTKLQEMDLSHTLIGELPPSVDKLDNLQVLKMVRTSLIGFPKAIKNLKKLEELDFTQCVRMRGECIITGLDSLRILRLKGTGIFRVLFRDIGNFCLHILEFDNSDNGQTAS
ncbi:disease resistance protein RUN1 [Eucalyptus grandis]|uniref:disease resistance protein RUN1 n=1 Tax=Eucalyptus grandis TaxID=71139 RepID=UPI00192E9BD7|nr:disease resistance protein RUN1 [Eucalyptus grandis]